MKAKKLNKVEPTTKGNEQLSKEVKLVEIDGFYDFDEVFARKCDTHAFIGNLKEQFC